jgi:acetyl esterase/lipase
VAPSAARAFAARGFLVSHIQLAPFDGPCQEIVMPSPQHEAIVSMLASQETPEQAPSIQESRQGFEAMAGAFATAEDVTFQAVDAGGVPSEWVRTPGVAEDGAVLYLHGGGYVIGSVATHRSLVGRIARASGLRALSVDYRLAPEHPYPAAVEDAKAAYRFLLSEGIDPARIVIAGDSAGGGLALATLVALREEGVRLPAAAVCMSPWVDLEGTGDSATRADDPWIELDGLREMGKQYVGGGVLRDPLCAPLYADLAGLPPLLIQVGTRELLLDDSQRVAERARAAGVDVTLEVEEGLIHVWQFFGDEVPESKAAVERIGAFVRGRTGA